MSPNNELETRSRNTASMISVLAILIAVAAIFLGVWNIHVILQNKFDHQAQAVRLQLLQQQLNKLHKTQNSEVLYLVHLANMQLVIGRDPASALKTLQFAVKQVPPTQLAVINLLNSNIAKLETAAMIEKNVIFAEIARLNQAIAKLPVMPAQPTVKFVKTVTPETSKNWRERTADFFKSLKSLFIIRHVNEPIIPLLNTQLEFAVKENIYLQLSISQWALMHGDNAVYQTSLQAATNSISRYFTFTDDKQPILEKLMALQRINVNPSLPSLDSTLLVLSQMDLASSSDGMQSEKILPISNKKKNTALPQQTPVNMEH